MLSFGLMTLQTSNEKNYFYEMAKRAHLYGIVCYRFVPSDINPTTEMVNGDCFNPKKDEWEKTEFPLPTILYDRCFYKEDPHSKQCQSIVKWLKTKENILFLGYGLPNKMELYEALSKTALSPYLLHSDPVFSGEQVIQMLNTGKPFMMKPIYGSQGRGIYYIQKKNNEIMVQTDKQEKTVTRIFPYDEKAIAWIDYLIKDRDFLIQEYRDLMNHNRQPFDIRALLQKDQFGKWQIIAKGIRTGKIKGIISNIHAGGQISSFDDWLESQPQSRKEYLNNEINEILHHLPLQLEQHFPPLFEIGADIGVCQDDSIWILDINSKPGRKIALTVNPSLEEHIYTSPLLFGKCLEQKRRQSDE